jgi:hypothetical protein
MTLIFSRGLLMSMNYHPTKNQLKNVVLASSDQQNITILFIRVGIGSGEPTRDVVVVVVVVVTVTVVVVVVVTVVTVVVVVTVVTVVEVVAVVVVVVDGGRRW